MAWRAGTLPVCTGIYTHTHKPQGDCCLEAPLFSLEARSRPDLWWSGKGSPALCPLFLSFIR